LRRPTATDARVLAGKTRFVRASQAPDPPPRLIWQVTVTICADNHFKVLTA
jgi:hypothetical protein